MPRCPPVIADGHRCAISGGSVDPRAVAVCHAELGLDRPLILQIVDFVWGICRLEVLREDHIRTARAKGASATALWPHTLSRDE